MIRALLVINALLALQYAVLHPHVRLAAPPTVCFASSSSCKTPAHSVVCFAQDAQCARHAHVVAAPYAKPSPGP
jgi:hypothetical protein